MNAQTYENHSGISKTCPLNQTDQMSQSPEGTPLWAVWILEFMPVVLKLQLTSDITCKAWKNTGYWPYLQSFWFSPVGVEPKISHFQ